MKLFSDQIPLPDEPLPDQVLLRVGWVEGLMMTGACLAFSLGALWLIVTGKGGLAVIALFVFAPGLYLGWRQIRTGGYFVLLSDQQIIQCDYGQRRVWRLLDLETCRVETRDGIEGVWCCKNNGGPKDGVFIEPGGRDPSAIASLVNRYRSQAIRREKRSAVNHFKAV